MKPAYAVLRIYDMKGSGTSARIEWVFRQEYLITYKNKKTFDREFMEVAKKHIKTSSVLYKTTSSKLLGRGFEMYGGDVKIEGYYLDYFRRRA